MRHKFYSRHADVPEFMNIIFKNIWQVGGIYLALTLNLKSESAVYVMNLQKSINLEIIGTCGNKHMKRIIFYLQLHATAREIATL